MDTKHKFYLSVLFFRSLTIHHTISSVSICLLCRHINTFPTFKYGKIFVRVSLRGIFRTVGKLRTTTTTYAQSRERVQFTDNRRNRRVP